VKVVFSSGTGTDAGNVLGFSSAAKDGYDAKDAAEPPRMGGDPYVFFYHPEWKRTFTEYARDIRGSMGDVSTFQIGIAPGGKPGKKASIAIEGLENLTSVYFFMGDEKGMVPVTSGTPYSVDQPDKVLYKTLFVTSDRHFLTRVPSAFSFGMPYPNPTRRMANIRYCLPYRFGTDGILSREQYQVNLGLYDVMGRQIRQLVCSNKDPGYYSVRWDGKNNSGLIVASGAYYLRLTAGPYSSISRIAVMK
jgi:hypothetical protein